MKFPNLRNIRQSHSHHRKELYTTEVQVEDFTRRRIHAQVSLTLVWQYPDEAGVLEDEDLPHLVELSTEGHSRMVIRCCQEPVDAVSRESLDTIMRQVQEDCDRIGVTIKSVTGSLA